MVVTGTMSRPYVEWAGAKQEVRPVSHPVESPRTEHGIEVHASPWYIVEQSDPERGRYVFGYRITIANRGERWAKLLSRHWIIVDADGRRHVVRGEGVVGRQPELLPGKEFAYSSFCPLTTPWGTMEGTYLMQREDDEL